MESKTYTVKGNKTAADVAAGNDEILETGYTLEEAKLAAVEYQRAFGYLAAWIEEEGYEQFKNQTLSSWKSGPVRTGYQVGANTVGNV